jgi:hypothetical protein
VLNAKSSFIYKPLNQKNMQQASRQLTTEESATIKRFLHERIEHAKKSGSKNKEKALLEEIFEEFYFGRYDFVIQRIRELGYDPQKILGITALRTAMLAGNLEHTPWFLREIAGLDWFFERDSKRSRKYMTWPHFEDKMNYLLSLAVPLEASHMHIIDKNMIRDAIDSLKMRITTLIDKVPEVVQSKARDTLERLETLRSRRIHKEKE